MIVGARSGIKAERAVSKSIIFGSHQVCRQPAKCTADSVWRPPPIPIWNASTAFAAFDRVASGRFEFIAGVPLGHRTVCRGAQADVEEKLHVLDRA